MSDNFSDAGGRMSDRLERISRAISRMEDDGESVKQTIDSIKSELGIDCSFCRYRHDAGVDHGSD